MQRCQKREDKTLVQCEEKKSNGRQALENMSPVQAQENMQEEQNFPVLQFVVNCLTELNP